MGVPMLMLGMRLSWTYDSVRRLTKSTQKLSILSVAVSKCFDFSGLEVMRATLLILFGVFGAVLCAGAENQDNKIKTTTPDRGQRTLAEGRGGG